MNLLKREKSTKSERITIMLDKDLSKKLRIIQSKKIMQGNHYSFSKTINEVLRRVL